MFAGSRAGSQRTGGSKETFRPRGGEGDETWEGLVWVGRKRVMQMGQEVGALAFSASEERL